MSRRVAVLGCTGSIGRKSLDIVEDTPGLELGGILCGSDAGSLSDLVGRYRPTAAFVAAPPPGAVLPEGISCCEDGPERVMEGADLVLNAIVGSAGLGASLACMRLGLPLALANKESLVVGGELLRPHLEAGLVIPVDSEHSTVARCLRGEEGRVDMVLLTASGGASRDIPLEELRSSGPGAILRHPTWDMGGRITVDSATMVNKAFEVIEARWLFPGLSVDVVMHPESVVHSLVRLTDGSWKALMGEPDMAVPIQHALQWPDRPLAPVASDDPRDWPPLTFGEPDTERYPAFATVLEAADRGGTMPAAVNAADEVAVEAFLDGRIPFGRIAEVLAGVAREHEPLPVGSLDDLERADREARLLAGRLVEETC